MKFSFLDGTISETAILDGSMLPKAWGVSHAEFDVILAAGSPPTVTGHGFAASPKDAKNAAELAISLTYAAQGFTDCEMSPKKFAALMGAFRNTAGSPAVDFRLPPRIAFSI